MSAVNRQPKKSNNFAMILGGSIGAGAFLLFAYLMWYVAPEESMERVRVVAVTKDGCVVETMDGFAMNIGECNAEADEYIIAPIDKKVRERAMLMNPTQ
ncbi:hypothetical protein BD31_I0726 [Candidatus Nitrosopumilus salaria BD31]|jgi:hypothetical protein|uniref:Uncharacterized protein n=1 Tax=Candidatus Nitrosopumilus salarius BD31 TaxID=859350 RepID=I3D161_9ARCH|nr:hypothetical protein [Candidatus Nitrosopumilus salaria]EIJ65454.1 hypothetical protein BD31_I0726 [Candidatus Nitrosopumilus salaria BD31]